MADGTKQNQRVQFDGMGAITQRLDFDALMGSTLAIPEPVKPESRSIAKDIGVGLLKGGVALGQGLSGAAGALTMGADDPNKGAIDETLKGWENSLQGLKSQYLQSKEAEFSKILSDDSYGVADVLGFLKDNPSLIAQMGAESLPAMAASVTGAGAVSKIGAVRQFIASGGKVRAALTTGAIAGASEGALMAGDVYNETGSSAAAAAALALGVATGPVAGNVTQAAAKRVIGRELAGEGVETAFNRTMGRRLGSAIAGEGGQEFIQEGGQAAIEQVIGKGDELDPNAVLKRATTGAVVGAAMGAGFQATPIGESAPRFKTQADRDNAVIFADQISAIRQQLANNPTGPQADALESQLATLLSSNMDRDQRREASDVLLEATTRSIMSGRDVNSTIEAFLNGQRINSVLTTAADAADAARQIAETQQTQQAQQTQQTPIPVAAGQVEEVAAPESVTQDQVAAARANLDLTVGQSGLSPEAIRALTSLTPEQIASEVQLSQQNNDVASLNVLQALQALRQVESLPTQSAPATQRTLPGATEALAVADQLAPTRRAALSRIAAYNPDTTPATQIAADVRLLEAGDAGASLPAAARALLQSAQAHTGVRIPAGSNADSQIREGITRGDTVAELLGTVAQSGSRQGSLLAQRLLDFAQGNPYLHLRPRWMTADEQGSRSALGFVQVNPRGEIGDIAYNPRINTESSTIHEAVHLATLSWLRTAPAAHPLVRRLENLYSHARTKARQQGVDIDSVYGLSNKAEFLAEAFSRAEFQELLRTIPSIEENTTLWQDIVEWVGVLLGVPEQELGSLADALSLTQSIMQESAAVAQRLAPIGGVQAEPQVQAQPQEQELPPAIRVAADRARARGLSSEAITNYTTLSEDELREILPHVTRGGAAEEFIRVLIGEPVETSPAITRARDRGMSEELIRLFETMRDDQLETAISGSAVSGTPGEELARALLAERRATQAPAQSASAPVARQTFTPTPTRTVAQNFADRAEAARRNGILDKLADFWLTVMGGQGQVRLKPINTSDLTAASGGARIAAKIVERYNKALHKAAVKWAKDNNQPAPTFRKVIESITGQPGGRWGIMTHGLARTGNPYVPSGPAASATMYEDGHMLATDLARAPGSGDIAYRVFADIAKVIGSQVPASSQLLTNNNIRRQWQTVASDLRFGENIITPVTSSGATSPQGVPANLWNQATPRQRIGLNIMRITHQVLVNRGQSIPSRAAPLDNLRVQADGVTFKAVGDPKPGGFPNGTEVTMEQLEQKLRDLGAVGRGQDQGVGLRTAAFAIMSNDIIRRLEESPQEELPTTTIQTARRAGRSLEGYFFAEEEAIRSLEESNGNTLTPESQVAVVASAVSPQHPNEIRIAGNRMLNLFERMSNKLRTLIQDQNVTLRRVLQAIGVGSENIRMDTMGALDRFPKLLEIGVRDYVKQPIEAIERVLRNSGLGEDAMRTFDKYLIARHAPEYNRHVAEINPQNFNTTDLPGSGITDEDARTQVAEIEAGQGGEQIIQAAEIYDSMIRDLQDYAIESGIETQEKVNAWREKFQYYTPFQRDLDLEDGISGSSQGLSVRAGISRRAMGSAEDIRSPLVSTAMLGMRTVNKGETAKVGQTVLNMAQAHTGMFKTKKGEWKAMWQVNRFPDVRSVKWVNVYQLKDSSGAPILTDNGMPLEFTSRTAAEAAIGREFNGQRATSLVAQGAQQRVVVTQNPNYIARDNVLIVPVNGENQAIVFNEQSEDAMAIVKNLKNMSTVQVNDLVAASGMISKWIVATATGYNPVFAPFNFARDLQQVLVNINADNIPGWTKSDTTQLAKDSVRNVKTLRTYLEAKFKERTEGVRVPDPDVGSDAWWLQELESYGGTTGVRESIGGFEGVEREMRKLFGVDVMNAATGAQNVREDVGTRTLQRLESFREKVGAVVEGEAKSGAAKFAGRVLNFISNFNNATELATRTAAFKAATQKYMAAGKSEAEAKTLAANIAKNISINFNRRGQWSSALNSAYPFFNAAVQGSARLAETLFTKKNVTLADGSTAQETELTPLGKKVVMALPALGALQAMILFAAGYDDDEPQAAVKDRNFVIPLGDGKYASIPMAYGFNVLFNIGREMTDAALHFDKAGKHLKAAIAQPISGFNPMGSTPNTVLNLAPAALDPIVALSMNRDAFDRPIAKEDFGANVTPGFTRYKEGTSGVAKLMAEGINWISGGSEYRPGAFSPTPDQIEYVAGQITGGVGREVGKAAMFGANVAMRVTGEDVEKLPWYKVPVAGKLVGDVNEPANVKSKLYEARAEINQLNSEYKALMADRKFEEARQLKAENPELELRSKLERFFDRDSDARKLRDKERRAGNIANVNEITEAIDTQAAALAEEIKRLKSQ